MIPYLKEKSDAILAKALDIRLRWIVLVVTIQGLLINKSKLKSSVRDF